MQFQSRHVNATGKKLTAALAAKISSKRNARPVLVNTVFDEPIEYVEVFDGIEVSVDKVSIFRCSRTSVDEKTWRARFVGRRRVVRQCLQGGKDFHLLWKETMQKRLDVHKLSKAAEDIRHPPGSTSRQKKKRRNPGSSTTATSRSPPDQANVLLSHKDNAVDDVWAEESADDYWGGHDFHLLREETMQKRLAVRNVCRTKEEVQHPSGPPSRKKRKRRKAITAWSPPDQTNVLRSHEDNAVDDVWAECSANDDYCVAFMVSCAVLCALPLK